MRNFAKERGLNVLQVYLISSTKGSGLQDMIHEFDSLEGGSEVFVMGCSNVGKSTFVNKLIDRFHLEKRLKTTTSVVPGTTLNMISIPLPKGGLLYDTPGIHNPNQLIPWLTERELALVVPKKRVKPAVWSLKEGHTIFIGGLGRIDYISGPPIYFTLFVSSLIRIHVTKISKADDLFQKHVGGLLSPPFRQEERGNTKPIPGFERVEYQIEGPSFQQACVDIVFAGLGWVSVTGKGTFQVAAYAPKGISISLRDNPLLPYETPTRRKNVVVKTHKKLRQNKPKSN
jgi:ribosome biogenesis GTPase A